jgi:outer membrane immunogenic protein
MKTILRSLVAAAALLNIPLAAHGADLPAAPSYQPAAAPAVVQQVYNWTGIYFGLNGGYTFGQSTPMSLFSSDYTAFNFNANGGFVGLTAGAQIQSGHTVIGIESTIDWADLTGSSRGPIFLNGNNIGTATLSANVNSISTIQMRIGYAADNWLIYGTGGLAVTNEKSTLTGATFICGAPNAFGSNPPCTSISSFHIGLAAGGGVEYGVTENLSVKAEYTWVGAGAINTLKENMVRVGANWRFGM